MGIRGIFLGILEATIPIFMLTAILCVCIGVCVYGELYVYVYVNVYVYVYVYVYMLYMLYMYMYMYMYICVCVCVCVFTCIHIYIYIYVYIHIYVHINRTVLFRSTITSQDHCFKVSACVSDWEGRQGDFTDQKTSFVDFFCW